MVCKDCPYIKDKAREALIVEARSLFRDGTVENWNKIKNYITIESKKRGLDK